MKLTYFRKMNLVILGPVITFLILLTFFTYEKAKNVVFDTLREQLTVIAKTQGENLHALIRAYKNMVEELSLDTVVIDVMKAYADDNSDWISLYKNEVDERVKRVASTSDSIYGVGIIDLKGKIVIHSRKERVGEDFNRFKFVKETLSGNAKPEIVKLAENRMGLVLAQPVYMEKNIVGLVFMVMDLNVLSERTIDFVSFAGSGTAGVHDANGVQIMHKNRKYVGLEEADSLQFKLMQGKESGRARYFLEGRERICYFYHISWLDWYISLPAWQSDYYAGITEIFITILSFVILAGVILFVVIFIFAKRTSTALQGVEGISQEVSNGRLELTPQEESVLEKLSLRSDEIGGLAQSFRKMFVALVNTIQQAKEAHRSGMVEAATKLEGIVESTSTATQELSAQVQESANGAEMQADRIASTVTAVEEMNATILEVTQNTLQTAQIATNTKQKAEESEVIVQEFMQSISKVEKSTSTLKDDMSTLSGHVQNINQIMGVISDLADQTNLLALNAAIEAARAGEFGRGFAVVADEVRKLAEKTMSSTVSVSNAVTAIQSSTESSMRQVDDTVSLVNSAIELAKKCHAALESIMEMATESAERIGSIAVASEEQSATSEEITRTIGDINSIVNQTSNTMREANVAIMELAKQAENLSSMVTSMKG